MFNLSEGFNSKNKSNHPQDIHSAKVKTAQNRAETRSGALLSEPWRTTVQRAFATELWLSQAPTKLTLPGSF